MSWRGKKRKEDYSKDEAPSSKKTSKQDSSEDPDTAFSCEISKNRRVAVRSWQGNPVVDIREFYVKDGKQLPGRKGGLCQTCFLLKNSPTDLLIQAGRYLIIHGSVENTAKTFG